MDRCVRKADAQSRGASEGSTTGRPAAPFSPFSERASLGVARVTPGDYDDLRGFLLRQYGPGAHQVDPASFAWRFDHHPDRPSESPILWVCRRDGHIVGQQAGLPLRLYVEGQPLTAAWAIDLMVDPAWRLRGVAPALTARLRDSYDLVCGLGISDEAHRAFRRAGWIDLGRVPRFIRLLRPLEASASPLGTWTPGRLGAWASRVAAPPLAAFDAAVAALSSAAGLRFAPVARFDERVDGLWRRAARHYPVIAGRDLPILAWRFDAAPQRARYHRYYLTQGEVLRGYAVLRRDGAVATVVDYLCAPQWLAPLLANCLRAARRDGAVVLSMMVMPRRLRAILPALGFVRRRGPRLAIAVKDGASLPAAALSRPSNWFISEADSDLDHEVRDAPA